MAAAAKAGVRMGPTVFRKNATGRRMMTTHAVKLKVIAGVPEDCSFWLEDDGWNGVCEDLSVKVRGSSFEDAKTKMEAALQTHIESVLRKHSRKSGKRVA
jgi:predicted RNase H-like HicB family nuclease